MVDRLNADKVTVFDAQEPYSVGLANTIERYLERRNVTVQRLSVTNNTTDFSSFVTRIASDTDIVYTPFQVAANANQIAVLLKEQGKRAIVFGGDGTADPAFKVPGSYYSNFAPDLNNVAGKAAIIAAWKRDNPERTLDPFGPPAYGAVQSILYAAKRACAGKRSIERVNIKRKMKAGPIPNWILGGDVPLLVADERSAERRLLALPDPVRRHRTAGRKALGDRVWPRLRPGPRSLRSGRRGVGSRNP